MACKFMSKVVYRDITAYQLDWLDIHHLFTDCLYIIFSMSYWWAYNSGVVEQNKVRKSWWKVINNFVNVFSACQLNRLFMQQWFQYILCHHWEGGQRFISLDLEESVSNSCFLLPRWLAILLQNIITDFT